jgi:hypothetical protein
MVLFLGRAAGCLDHSADAVAAWARNPAGNEGYEISKAGLSKTAVEVQQQRLQALRDAWVQHGFPSTSSLLLLAFKQANEQFLLSLGRRRDRAKLSTKVSAQRVEKDSLHRESMTMLAVEFPSSLRLSYVNPVGCAIAGTLEAVLVNESFQESRLIPVALLPIRR